MLRRTFLTGTTAALAIGTSGLIPALAAQAGAKDTATLALLTTAADGLADAALTAPSGGGGYGGARGTLRQMRRLVTPFIWPDSRHFHSDALIQPIETLLARVGKLLKLMRDEKAVDRFARVLVGGRNRKIEIISNDRDANFSHPRRLGRERHEVA